VGLSFRSLAASSTAVGLLLVSRPERALARSHAQPLSVVRCLHIWFQFAPAITIARAIVLQVKEDFYRLGNNSTGLGEKQTLSNE
jgi:hypothetical protein